MTSVVLAAPIAFLLRRWRPPAGTFTLVFTLLVVLFEGVAEFAHPPVILAGVVAGLLADALVRRHVAIWNTCAATVAALWLSYFALYAISEGSVAWTAELWTGSTFLGALLAAGVGLLAATSKRLEARDDAAAPRASPGVLAR